MEQYHSICQHLYEATQIPALLVAQDGHVVAEWSRFSKTPVPEYGFKMAVQDFELQKRDALHPTIFHIKPGYLFAVAKLDAQLYWVTGLVSPVHRSYEEIFAAYGQETLFTPEALRTLATGLLNSPLVTLSQLKSAVCLLLCLVHGTMIPEENILLCNDEDRLPIGQPFQAALFQIRETPEAHVTTQLEERIAALVAAGNVEELARYMRKPEQGQNGKMSEDPLRQMKYHFVGFTMIVSRAAIKGGMDEEEALTLSDLYCQRVDVMTQAIDILRTFYEMSMDFCRKVQQGKQGSYSPTVQKCLHYISRHLHENIRAEHLALLTGLSSKTVAEHFRQETGYSIPDYLHAQRVEEAKYLLRYTEYSLAEISGILNYASQSYFTKIFRDRTGQTPQQYRDCPQELTNT